MLTNSGLTLNGLTVNDYLADYDVHLTGGIDTEESNDNDIYDDEVDDEEDNEILSRLMRRELF